MKWKSRMVALAAFAIAITSGLVQFDVGAAGAVIAQSFSFYGYDGGSAVAGAVAQSLLQGDTTLEAADVASTLASIAGSETDQSIQTVLGTADDVGIGGTVNALLDLTATNPADLIGERTGLPPPSDPTGSGYNPPQAKHGECCAVTRYNWELHGSSSVNIYYGDCLNSCETDGWIVATNVNSNTNFAPDAYWNSGYGQGSGEHASFSNHKVRVFEDITNASDPVKGTLGCTTSGYSALDCQGTVRSPTLVGHWYYYREDFHLDYFSGAVNVQIQSRRWEVLDGGTNWQFKAFNTGG